MKCAIVYRSRYFYNNYKLPLLIDFVGLGAVETLKFNFDGLENSSSLRWIMDKTVVLKKVVLDTRLNRTLYPEAKELDGYLILNESHKADDFLEKR